MIHYGNGNYKRKVSACGAPVQLEDTVTIEDVTCVDCLMQLLNRGSKKKGVIERRIALLRSSDEEFF